MSEVDSKSLMEIGLDLSMNKVISEIVENKPEHKEMIEYIEGKLPEINHDISLFGKPQSQFMDNQLTVSHLTPQRNIRQILAECSATIEAYRASFIECEKKAIEVKILERDLEKETDALKAELIKLDIAKINNELYTKRNYVSGAIRKLTNYFEQIESIKKTYKIENYSEKSFEEEEEQYHISKVFQQGVCSARARGGLGGAGIDAGNMIYLEQIGISGALANLYIQEFFKREKELIEKGCSPTEVYNEYLKFINEMCIIFKGSYKVLSRYKGMTGTITEKALLEK